jgi:TetR/AcrR family transcriptional repressor of nem operon
MGRTSDARDRMVSATIDLILKDGYADTTVDAVCSKAGVKKGSFYHFFESREILITTALEAYWSQLRPDLDRLFSPSIAPAERIKGYFMMIKDLQRREQLRLGSIIGCILLRVGSALGTEQNSVRDKVRELFEEMLRYFESAIRDGQREGVFARRPVEPSARALLDYFEGTLGTARVMNDLGRMDDFPARALDFLGVRPVPRPGRRPVDNA